MISSAEFAAYNRAVARIGDKAASDVEASVLAWCRANASASVAEKREAAKLIMDGYIQGYDDIAAVFAAEWYDRRAQKSGVALDQAITMTTYKPESVDAVARYQAKKLAKGGDAEFAKACGEFARNDAFRSLNETIVANVGRDRDKGARFARVPTGLETCTFCLMLASRGAVYHTRKSAGEWKHFHRGCDCKVVPSFEDDPYAEVVEGVKPRELQERWERFKEIDATEGLSAEQKDARKRKILNLAEAKSNPATEYRADNLDLSKLAPGELKRMQKYHPLEWKSYVHLSERGYGQALLSEQGNASANIDISMLLDGDWHYWDMKTILGGIHALKKRMTECYSKWTRLINEDSVVPDSIDKSLLDYPRAAIDNRYSEMSDREARQQIRESMVYLSDNGPLDFPQAVLILKNGSIETIYK